MKTLHLPYFSRLLNDPIFYDPCCPPMLTTFPSDIPKFQGKPGEDPGDHVTTFHLWCSSNSLNHESIKLQFFEHTLIWVAVKWYIKLNGSKYAYFNDLEMIFLKHF
jgi:hypothetical protein